MSAFRTAAYTIDIVTDDRAGRLVDPFIDPTDKYRMIRVTGRASSTGGFAVTIPSTFRLLPFNLDQKYSDDEVAHGHGETN